MIPALNPLVLSLKESATLAINERARELRRSGKEVYHFGFGQSPFPVPEIIQDALRKNSDKNNYLPTQGLPELCDAVADFYQKEFLYDFKSSNVLIGPGSKELIFQLIYLIEGVLLVPAPSWVSYGPQAALRGKEIVPIDTERENGYRLTAEELDHACHSVGEKQKLLIINNPNNPTGSVYTDEEMEELAAICRAYRVLVISDEIYSMINSTGKQQASMCRYYPEGTIVTGGISKSFAAGGYRLGVMLIPFELDIVMNALKSVASETFSAVCSPVQYAALEAYRKFDRIRPFIKKSSEIFSYARGYLRSRFLDMGLNCPASEGAFYLFPDFDNFRHSLHKKGIMTGRDLVGNILKESGVAMLPGSDFYLPATNLGMRVAAVDFDGGAAMRNWPGTDSNVDNMLFFPNLVRGCDSLQEYCESVR